MSRIRLTQRTFRAVDDSIQYPGNLNQPDRKFKKHDEYDNYEEVVNYPLPDMRTEWENDAHDELGFGIPEPWNRKGVTASSRVAATKAVKLAYMLLGDKVAESVIESQARDFMRLGHEAMDRSLARMAKTDELYASEDEDDKKVEAADDEDEKKVEAAEEEEKEETKTAGCEKLPEGGMRDNCEKKVEEGKENDKKEDGKKASEDLVEEKDTTKVETEGANEKTAKTVKKGTKAAEEKKEEKEVEAADDDEIELEASEDEDDEEEVEVKASKKSSVKVQASDDEDEVELTSSMEEQFEGEIDEELANLFDDDIPDELPPPSFMRKGSKKGIKSLGGQPRVAAASLDDCSSIWESAPDVSEIFR